MGNGFFCGKDEGIQFFSRKGNPLTVVSEGEEVVWTNFDAGDLNDKTYRYDLPRSNGSESTVATNSGTLRRTSATGDVGAKPKPRRSIAEESTGGQTGLKKTPSMTGAAMASAKRRTSGNDDTMTTTGSMHEMVVPPTNQILKASGSRKVIEVPVNEHAIAKVKMSQVAEVKSSGESVEVNEPVKVVPNLVCKGDDELSIMSLNMLADFNLTNSINNPDDGRYKHAVELASWNVRLPALRAVFESNSGCDVFALQEVDFTRYQEDLVPMFATMGYAGAHQWDADFAKKGAPNHPFGVATFYKTSKFKEAFKEARSRSFVMGLAKASSESASTSAQEENPEINETNADKSSKKKKDHNKKSSKQGVKCDWFIVNVHLEADPRKNEKRLAQLSSALFNLSTHARVNPTTARVIVLGDFNSLSDEAPVQWLLNNYKPGTATGASTEPASTEAQIQLETQGVDGGEDDQQDKKMVHAFNFADGYAEADQTTRRAATYADPFANGRVDHLLFTCETCKVRSALAVPALNDYTRKFGIFGKEFPSDHYPIGCVFKALEVKEPEPSAEQEDEDDPNYCPLTTGQMRVLEFLEEGAPRRANKSGKPSASELAALKAHTERVNAFASHLNAKQKTWVNKWRKKYRPKDEAKQETVEPSLKERLSRSRSFAGPHDAFGISDLFGEGSNGGTKSSPSASKSKPKFEIPQFQKPKTTESSENSTVKVELDMGGEASSSTKQEAKRRATVHGKKTTFLEL